MKNQICTLYTHVDEMKVPSQDEMERLSKKVYVLRWDSSTNLFEYVFYSILTQRESVMYRETSFQVSLVRVFSLVFYAVCLQFLCCSCVLFFSLFAIRLLKKLCVLYVSVYNISVSVMYTQCQFCLFFSHTLALFFYRS